MRKKVAIAAGLAAVAVISLWLWSQSVVKDVGGGNKVWVTVAAEDMGPGQRVNKASLAYREVPESYIHPGTVLRSEANEILNHAVSDKIAQGQPFLWSNFGQVKGNGASRLSQVVQKGQRALTIPVDLAGSLAGQLRPGDHVDIMGTFARNQGTDYATVTLLQNVLVVAIGDVRGDSAEAEGNPSGGPGGRTFSSITVSTDLEEAELLVFAMQRGPVNIALRSAEDIETEEQVPDKNFGDIFEAPKRQSFARRHAAKIQALKAQ